jgi:CBS domain-containing protein
MKIADVMTRDVRVIQPDRTVREAARLMDELNVGALPVCNGRRLIGMVTDRDITVRSTAAGLAPIRATSARS